jgi:CHAP domain
MGPVLRYPATLARRTRTWVTLTVVMATAIALGTLPAGAAVTATRPAAAVTHAPAHASATAPAAGKQAAAKQVSAAAGTPMAKAIPGTVHLAAHSSLALAAKATVMDTSWQNSLFRATCTSQSTSTGVCKAFTLVFTNPAPSTPYVGQVLISTVTSKLPDGILAKVTAVSTSGAYTTVTASAATPADAVTGSGSGNVDLTPYVQQAAAKIAASSGGKIHIVAASQVPASARARLAANAAKQAARAAASGSSPNCTSLTIPFLSGIYLEVANLQLPPGLVPGPLKGKVSIYFSGWVYFEPSFQFAFNPDSSTLVTAQFTSNLDTTGYVHFLGPAGKALNYDKNWPLPWAIPLPPIAFLLGPVPVVITPSIEFKFGVYGELLLGVTVDYNFTDAGLAIGVRVDSQGKPSPIFTLGRNYLCPGVGGGTGFAQSWQPGVTATIKAGVYVTAALSAKLWGVVGVDVGPQISLETWISVTQPAALQCPQFEIDTFLGIELSFEFEMTGINSWKIGAIGLGLTHMWNWGPFDICTAVGQIFQPPPGQSGPGQPTGPGNSGTGWVYGHATNAGNDYPYEGLGLYEHHDGTDPWNEWYGQCDSFAAWKVYENVAGAGAQHPPFRPDRGWAPGNPSVSPVIGFASGSPAGNWGDARDWGAAAQRAKIPVDGNPAPGAIAWWGASPDMPLGHVGYVTDVYPDGSIRIESYNLRANGMYSTIVMTQGGTQDTSFGDAPFYVPWPSGFIHLDQSYSPTPVTYPAGGGSYPLNVWGPGSAAGFSVAGSAFTGTNHGWYTQAGHGLIGQELWTNTHGATPDSSATWDPLLTANACYAISAFIPDNYANGTGTYSIHAADGTHPAVVSQEAYTNAWAPLGTFKTDITGYVGVTLTDQSPAGFYLAADAVMFAPTSCQDAGGSSLIIDPASPGSQFALGGPAYPGTVNGWYSRPGHGLGGHEVWTNSNGPSPSSTANWTAANLVAGACYTVAAYIPDNYANAAANYTIFDGAGLDSTTVDQQAYTNAFAELGVYRADGKGQIVVQLTDMGTTGYYVAADAVMFTPSTCSGVGQGNPGTYPGGVIGPGSAQFSAVNWWASNPGHGLIGQEKWTHTNGSTADSMAFWSPDVVAGACYAISAYIPDNYASNPATHYSVAAADGSRTAIVNQEAYTNQYAVIGTYQATSYGTLEVTVTDAGTPGYYVAADAIMFQPAPCSSQSPPGGTYTAGVYGPGSGSFSTTNWWSPYPGHGLTGQMLWSHANGTTANSTATWSPTLLPNRCYTVAAYVPDGYSNNPAATYYIWHNALNPARPATAHVNENSYTNAWATLGNYTTFDDGSISVELTDLGTTGQYVAADAVRFVPC